jgi:acetate kinase
MQVNMSTSTSRTILALNSGSSSLKFGLFAPGEQDEDLLLQGMASGIGRQAGTIQIRSADGARLFSQDHVLESPYDALTQLSTVLREHMKTAPVAVGHRIVHGGPHLREHQPLTPAVIKELESAMHFAPLHIPQALKLVRMAEQVFPDALQIACFDTAFHCTMPDVARRLPLPKLYFDQGVMRYGFHGLSYESLVHRLGIQLPRRAVFAHLGNGCSVAAVLDGKSIDTSMGLTPTGGVPMSTRAGDLDPGVLLYLMRTDHMDSNALEELLNRHSGLAGLSDGESDMQALLERANKNDPAAELAIAAFCTAVRKFIGAYAALMGGIDLLVFTGGIGEHSAEIRHRICEGLEFIGLNPAHAGNGRVKVMPSDEERQIARHCRAIASRLMQV